MTDRFEKLDAWLDENNCSRYLMMHDEEITFEYWVYPGGTAFIVMRTDTDWEMFTPASSTNKVYETLRAAERQLGGGTVEERIKQVLKGHPDNLYPIDRVEIDETFDDHYVVTMYYVEDQGYEHGLRVDKEEL